MNIQLDQSIEAVKKRRMAIVVTSITSAIIVTSMIAISTLKPNDIFGSNPKIEHEQVNVSAL